MSNFTLIKRPQLSAPGVFTHVQGVSLSFLPTKEMLELYDPNVQLRIIVKRHYPFVRERPTNEPQTVIYTDTATLANGAVNFGIQSESGEPIYMHSPYDLQFDPINNANETTGGGLGIPVTVVNGGTERTSLTAGQVLVGDGVNPVDLSKAAPTGDFVGTSDIQTLTNKTLDDVTNDITSNALFFGANKVDTNVVIPTAGQLLSASGPNTMGFVDFDTVVSGGDGVNVTGNVVSADPKANGGLVIDTAQLAVDLGATAMTGVPNGFVTGDGSVLSAIKYNHVATTAPTATDDSSAGYAVGSRWIDTTNNLEYVCVDASVGAAVWIETTQQAAGVLIGGDGIDVTGNTISMDPLANGGLDFSVGQARVNLSGNAMTGIANGLLVGNAGTSIAGLKLNQTNVPPTVNDDGLQSYTIGSRWFDIAADREFVALDVTPGAAVWRDCTQQLSELLGGNGITYTSATKTIDLDPLANGGIDFSTGQARVNLSGNALTGVPQGILFGDGTGNQVLRLPTNFTTTNPTVNDDLSAGYGIASRWWNTANDTEWICMDNTNGASIWKETTQQLSSLVAGAGIDITGTTIDVDLKANGGLVIESTEIGVDLGATAMTNVPTGFVTGNGSSLSAIKYNYTAAVDPTPANDSSENYVVGSTWINLTSGVEFQCVDASVGAAQWESNVSLESGGTSGYENINVLFNPDVRWEPVDITGATGAVVWNSSVGSGSVLPQGLNTSFSPNSLGGQTSVHINPATGSDATHKFVLDLGATFNGTDDFSGVFVVQDLENFAPSTSRFITFLDSTPFVQSDFNQPTNIAALVPTATGDFFSFYNNVAINHTTTTNASVTAGNPTVIAFRYIHSSTEWKIWINQSSDLVQTTNTRNLGALAIASIGLGFSNTGITEQGRIRVSEILWWGSALTDQNVLDVSDLLLKYYGVRPFSGAADYSNRYVFHDGTRWKAKLKSEYAKTVAPTVNDDLNDGYEVGSVWVDIVANKTYICTSASVGVAVWVETSQQLSSLVAGNGIDITGNTIDVDLKANGGLDIQSTELALNLGHTNLSNVPLGILVGNAGTSIAGFKLNQTSVDPTVNDDGLQSYTIGSRWYNTTTDREFVALDVTPGAAVWRDTTQQLSELVGGNGITYTPATKTIDLDPLANGGIDFSTGQARVNFGATALANVPDGLIFGVGGTSLNAKKITLSVGGTPGVNEDTTQGYQIGSRWWDSVGLKEYVAVRVTAGNALWKDTSKERFFELNDVYVPREDIAFLNQTATYSVPLRLNNNLLDKPILSSWNDGVVVPDATANVIVGNALVDGLSGIKVTSAAGAIYGIDATGPLPNINTNGFSAIFLVGDIPAPAVTRNILTVASSAANYFVAATNRLLIDIDASGALVLTREGSTPVSSAPGTLFASKWNVICVTYTYDGTNSTFRAYVNDMTTEVCALGFSGLWGLITHHIGLLGNHIGPIIHDACFFNSSINLATRTNIAQNYQNRKNFIGPIPESEFRWNGVAMSRGQKIVYREGSNPGNADNHTLGYRRGDLVIRLDNNREFICVHNSTVATWDRLD